MAGRKEIISFRPANHENVRQAFIDNVVRPGFAPDTALKGFAIYVVKDCVGEGHGNKVYKVRIHNQALWGQAKAISENVDFSPRGARFIPEMQLVFPLRCLTLPMFRPPNSVTLDIGDIITSYSMAGIFAATMWQRDTSMHACLELTLHHPDQGSPVDVARRFSERIITTKHVKDSWDATPELLYYWIYDTQKPNVMWIEGGGPLIMPITVAIYAKFDTTLDTYIRNYVKSLLNIASKNDTFFSYIDELVRSLSASMHDYLDREKATNQTSFSMAILARDYAINVSPLAISILAWDPSRMINATMLRDDMSKASKDRPYNPPPNEVRHPMGRPNWVNMYKPLFLRLAAQEHRANDSLLMKDYAYLLFRMVVLNELVDVLEICRGELLRDVYSDPSSSSEKIVSYDIAVDRVHETMLGDLIDVSSLIQFETNV